MEIMKELQAKAREGFTDWEQYGNVKAVYKDDLILFNYTAVAQWEGTWNWFERVSRGLILNTAGEVIARPFDKFFNWGECGRKSSGHIVTVTEKIDGSLGILYRTNGEYRISTRGSFDSEQAIWATDHLNTYYDLADLPDDLTLMFEIVYPENRIVVDYGNTYELFLLAARKFSGEYLPFYPDVYELGRKYNFVMPNTYQFNNVTDILEACEKIDGTQEGWVVEFSDGQRFKFKGNTYVELHRLVTNTSFKRVLSWVADGSYNAMIDGVPEEFLDQVREWKTEIDAKVHGIKFTIEYLFQLAPKDDRKTFAVWVNQNAKIFAPYLFMELDGRDCLPLIYKKEF